MDINMCEYEVYNYKTGKVMAHSDYVCALRLAEQFDFEAQDYCHMVENE